MGDLVPFRRRRWTRPRDYGAEERRPRFWPKERGARFRRLASAARPFALLALLFAVAAVFEPALVDPPEAIVGAPERVNQRFSRCGPGRGHACVIDGDTFKLGERKVRVVGIDAPEVHGSCPRETQLATQATAALLENLNRGPFEMVRPIARTRDQYGRDLRVLRRKRPDGSYNWIARQMIETGLAHRYVGGIKTGWC